MLLKPKNIISKAIRASAKNEQCTMRLPGICDHDPAKVMACHVGTPFKGMANKSPDIFIYYGCNSCHRAEEAGEVSKADQLRAMVETQMKLFEKDLIKVRKTETKWINE